MNISQQLLKFYIQNHTDNVLSVIENLQVEEIVEFLESIPSEWSTLLLSQMDRYRAVQCFERINIKLAAAIFEKFPVSNSEMVLRLIHADLRGSILEQMPEKVSQNLQRILRYPKNTAGAFINPIVFTLSQKLTVKNALEKIRKEKPQLSPHLYVLDRNQLLIGHVEIKQLISADENLSIQSILVTNSPKIIATTNISVIIDDAAWVDSNAELPIVDNNGVFLGILSKEALEKITNKSKNVDHQIYQTGAALGELYKIGLTSFLRNSSEITVNKTS